MTLALDEAAVLFGVPRAQLLRWCRDGVLQADEWRGTLYAPDRIMLDRDALQRLAERLSLPAVRADVPD